MGRPKESIDCSVEHRRGPKGAPGALGSRTSAGARPSQRSRRCVRAGSTPQPCGCVAHERQPRVCGRLQPLRIERVMRLDSDWHVYEADSSSVSARVWQALARHAHPPTIARIDACVAAHDDSDDRLRLVVDNSFSTGRPVRGPTHLDDHGSTHPRGMRARGRSVEPAQGGRFLHDHGHPRSYPRHLHFRGSTSTHSSGATGDGHDDGDRQPYPRIFHCDSRGEYSRSQ